MPSPLLAPLRRVVSEDVPAGGEEHLVAKKRRRGKKHGGSENHSWEVQSHSHASRRGEKRQMRLMLIGGATLLALIVAGVAFSMKSGPKSPAPSIATTTPAPSEAKAAQAPAAPSVLARGEASLLAEAEPLARKFLEAKTVDQLLPLVRNPQVSEARIRAFYPDGKIEAVGLSALNTTGGVSVRGKMLSVSVSTRDQDTRSMAFVDSPQGLKVDWESWVGWSEISWEKFLSSKPTAGQVFRVTLSQVDYYNFGFADESKWQSYRLVSPDGEHSIYGYVEKGTVLAQRIRPDADTKSAPLILSLKFPPGAPSNSQVEIDRFVADGWVEETD